MRRLPLTNPDVTNANAIGQRSSFLRTTLLGFFIVVAWVVPDTIDLIGKNVRFTNKLLSGLNTRSIFYPLFALLGAKYFADCFLSTRFRVRNMSSILFFLTMTYIAVVGYMLQIAGEGYSPFRFILAVGFFTTYTCGIYLAATGGRMASYRKLSSIICWVGLVLAGILIIETFVIGENLYGYLFNYYFVDPSELWIAKRNLGMAVARSRGPFRNPLMAGFALLLPLSVVLSRIGIYSPSRNAIMVLGLCTIGIGIVATVSFSAIIPALVMVVTYGLLYLWLVKGRAPDKAIIWIVVITVGVIVPLVTPLGHVFYDMVAVVRGNPEPYVVASTMERYTYTVRGIQLWADLPLHQQLVGKGFGFLHYDRLAFLREFHFGDFGMYITALLEVGLVGLIGFVVFFALWFRSTIERAGRSISLAKKTAYMASGAYVVSLLVAFGAFFYYNMFYVIAIGYAVFALQDWEGVA